MTTTGHFFPKVRAIFQFLKKGTVDLPPPPVMRLNNSVAFDKLRVISKNDI